MCFFRLLQLVLQTLRNTLLQHLPKPPHAMLHRSRAQLNLYMPPPVPEKTSMGIPPSPPQATITLGLGLIEAHSPVSALLCVYPPNCPTSSESHIVAADILQCPGHYKNPPYLLLDPLQQHHRVSPSERLISERLAFDVLSISLTWTKSQPVYPTTSKTS